MKSFVVSHLSHVKAFFQSVGQETTNQRFHSTTTPGYSLVTFPFQQVKGKVRSWSLASARSLSSVKCPLASVAMKPNERKVSDTPKDNR